MDGSFVKTKVRNSRLNLHLRHRRTEPRLWSTYRRIAYASLSTMTRDDLQGQGMLKYLPGNSFDASSDTVAES